ncbi:glycosyltransferase family 4 protein [Salinisphaera orenii]|uniref:glycosyltransferase family 4 protein n=1 Tax=Salinisphaera orenii TaxID=856731 RepID=UPI000DBE163E
MHFIVAGKLDQATGGYRYDARIVAGLRDAGWRVVVHELDGCFATPDDQAASALEQSLASIDSDQLVVIDSLALGGLPEIAQRCAQRLTLAALVHHALADEHDTDAMTRRRWLASEHQALAAATRVITTSDYTANRLLELELVATRPAVAEPGVEPRPCTTPNLDMPLRLCCVASIIPRKDNAGLVAALAQLRDLNWRCDIVGALDRDPATTTDLRRRIERHGLGERVHLRGILPNDELDVVYRQADLFVLASRFEGYGMVITEALAYGLPIVTTTGGALRDTVPANAGLTVPPNDVPALRSALARVLGNRTCFDALVAGARRARKNLLDWPAATQRFTQVLAEMDSIR